MSSSQSSTTGIFAKLVAKFLVKWIKKTLNKNKGGNQQPALSAVPSEVTGRPDRDRANENMGQHTGSTGPRASEAPAPATALQGDTFGQHAGSTGPRASEAPAPATALQGGTYGQHGGSTGPRASEAPAPATALQGGTYGQHRGVTTTPSRCTSALYDPRELDRRLAAMWTGGEQDQRRDALRGADQQTLRDAGMNDRQVAQAGNGRVPQGYQMEKVPGSDSNPAHYQLSPLNQQSHHNCNAVNSQIVALQLGDVSVISFPIGGQQITVVLGGAAVLAG